MQAFVINLDRSPQRLERMKLLLSGLGLDFIRMPAVDGLALAADAEIPKDKGLFYRLGPGETGCFLSHIKCWEAVAAGQAEYTLIFEDDVHFGEEAGELLRGLSWVPKDADLVKLETTLVRTLTDRSKANVVAGRSVRRLQGAHPGTGAYIISRQGARKLLDRSKGFADPVDQFMFNPSSAAWNELTIYQLDPAICVQEVVIGTESPSMGLGSGLKLERPAQAKASRGKKLIREISRPLARVATALGARLRGQQWARVPFR